MATKTYLLQPEKKVIKQGYLMTDENGETVYEAKVLKQPLIGAMQVEFINRLTGVSSQHKIGQTVTSQTFTGGLSDMFSVKSHFKYDGEKIWDYLHGLGIRINSALSGNKIGMTYEVSLKGSPLAKIASSTPKGKSIITTSFFYDVTCDEADLDLAFLVAYSIARTEQTFYS